MATALPVLLLTALLHTTLAWTAYKSGCAYRPQPRTPTFKIRMGMFGKVSTPWHVPNPLGFRCLEWGGSNVSALRLNDSVCYKIDVTSTGFYSVHLSMPLDRGLPKQSGPTRAVVRFFETPETSGGKLRFVDWIDYEGPRVMTKRMLEDGRRYKVCVAGRRQKFTACSLRLTHCGSTPLAQCYGGMTGASEWGRFLSVCQ